MSVHYGLLLLLDPDDDRDSVYGLHGVRMLLVDDMLLLRLVVVLRGFGCVMYYWTESNHCGFDSCLFAISTTHVMLNGALRCTLAGH